MHERVESERFLLFAMAGLAIGDVVYMLSELHVISPHSTVANAPFALAYVVACAAIVDPSVREVMTPVATDEAQWSLSRVILICAGLATPALLLLQVQQTSLSERLGLFATVIVCSAVAILQIVRALYDVERSESRLKYQAPTMC